MSIEALNWAFGLTTPKSLSTMGSWKAVLLSLANHADKHGGNCFPGVEKIGQQAGVSVRTVTDVLKRLAAAGLIVPGRNGRKATYTLVMDWIPEASSIVEDASTQEDASIVEDGSTVEDSSPILEDASDDTGSIFHESRKHLPANLKEPSEEPSGNRHIPRAHASGDLLGGVVIPLRPAPNGYGPDFDEFWQAYPRKEGKAAARKAYVAALKKTTPDVILAAVKARRWSPDPQYIKHPSGWLNGERWKDEVDNRDPVLVAAERAAAALPMLTIEGACDG